MLRTFLVVTRTDELQPGFGPVVRRIADLYGARLIFALVRPASQLKDLQTSPAPFVTGDPKVGTPVLGPSTAAAGGESGVSESKANPGSSHVRHVILAGEFMEAVCDKGHEADAIMIWHGELRDSEGEASDEALAELMRSAPRPIWLVREPVAFPEHILIAYDGSAHSGRALHLAANLAETLGARLTVLNVDESRDDVAQELVLSRAAGYCEAYNITMERVGLFGRAAESVESYVKTSGCQLLVVGAAGVGYLRGLLFGSVAGQLIAQAPCSVLVAK
jgi:nucleotide-binding universal stress UspA family protein